MIKIGIDPGRWGALAVLIDGAPVDAWPLEQTKLELKSGKCRYEPDIDWLVKEIYKISFKHINDSMDVYLEQLKSGAQGKGAFTLGVNYGIIKGALIAMKKNLTIRNVNLVPVNTWKSYFGLKEERRAPGAARKAGAEKKAIKQKSIDKVMELWPVFDIQKFTNFEVRSGVADAILIAASQS